MTDAPPLSSPGRGKILWHFTMSLDGFVAGPGGSMDWMSGLSIAPQLSTETLSHNVTTKGLRRTRQHDMPGAGTKGPSRGERWAAGTTARQHWLAC